jgi:hypothetical protein
MNELLMLSLLMWMWSSAPPALCVTLLWVGRNPWYWTSLSKESLCLSLFLTFTQIILLQHYPSLTSCCYKLFP